MFKHTDGKILINDGDGAIRIPFSEFIMNEPNYSLPLNAVGRFYNGVRHSILYPTHQVDGGIPYLDGEKFIGRKQFYLDQIAQRHPPAPTPPPRTDDDLIDEAFPQTGPSRVLFKILLRIMNQALASASPPSSITPAEFRTMLKNELLQ